ncbi:hypothetical protein P3G55_20555 [Leptospira sp. 96542]|nr:hypothetical protein [Leptospira sp. 96542]
MKRYIILIFVFTNCMFWKSGKAKHASVGEFATFKSEDKQELVFKFSNFKNLPVKFEISIQDVKKNVDSTFECNDTIFQSKLEYENKDIKITLDKGRYCINLFVYYQTFRPFWINEYSGLRINFGKARNCEQFSAGSIKEFNCDFLELSNLPKIIEFENISTGKTDETKTFLTWGLTFLASLRPPPYIYGAPIPLLVFGYKSVKNDIHFDIK